MSTKVLSGKFSLLGLALALSLVSGEALASAGCDALASAGPYYGSGGVAGDFNTPFTPPDPTGSTYADIPTWDQFVAGNIIHITSDGPTAITWSNIGTVTFSGTDAYYTVTDADVARGATKFFASWTGQNGFSYVDFDCDTGTETGGPSGSTLRNMQINATKVAAQRSATFQHSSTLRETESRLWFCEPDNEEDQSTEQDDVGLCNREDRPEWNVWSALAATGYVSTSATGDEYRQFNGVIGIDRLINENTLVGIMAGIERSDANFSEISGKFIGDGLMLGGYASLSPSKDFKLDVAGTWTRLLFNSNDQTASASFMGTRLTASADITAHADIGNVDFEPTAGLLAIYQTEEAYTDSADASYDARSFLSARGTFGARLQAENRADDGWTAAPYLGAYGDYWFGWDDAIVAPLGLVPEDNGWSARVELGADFLSEDETTTVTLGTELATVNMDIDDAFWTLLAKVSHHF